MYPTIRSTEKSIVVVIFNSFGTMTSPYTALFSKPGASPYRSNNLPVLCWYNLKVGLQSIELNWDVKDIVLATNFEFEYRGVKSVILEKTCDYSQFFNKEYAITELLEKGIFKDTKLWYHDLDAFQLEAF